MNNLAAKGMFLPLETCTYLWFLEGKDTNFTADHFTFTIS